jgi:nicotinamidase-related amidase
MLSARAHEALLDPARSAVLVIDVQERFRPYVELDRIATRIRLLVAGAVRLGVPVAASEHYPSGLGATIRELELPAGTPTIAKLEFAACAADGWGDLPEQVRDAAQFVLVGIEAHVCLRHTALALLAAGRDVHVAIDAVASHETLHASTSIDSLVQAGARPTTVEQALFDWLGEAGTPEFRDVQALIRAAMP